MVKEFLPEIIDESELKRLVRLAYRGNTDSARYLYELVATKQEYCVVIGPLVVELQRAELASVGLKSDTAPSWPGFTERWLSN